MPATVSLARAGSTVVTSESYAKRSVPPRRGVVAPAPSQRGVG
jgi:hypothetical protein